MPTGVILRSGSPGVTEEDLRNVAESHGYTVDEPGEPEPEEPKEKRVRDLYPKSGYTNEQLAWMETNYNHRCQEYREQFPDFGKEGHGLTVPNNVIFEVKRLGNPALAYHLYRDREWLQKLWNLTPYEQVKEVRRMHEGPLKPDTEAGVRYHGSTRLRSVAQTPAPERPKKGSMGAAKTFQEFKELYSKHKRESR